MQLLSFHIFFCLFYSTYHLIIFFFRISFFISIRKCCFKLYFKSFNDVRHAPLHKKLIKFLTFQNMISTHYHWVLFLTLWKAMTTYVFGGFQLIVITIYSNSILWYWNMYDQRGIIKFLHENWNIINILEQV